MQRLSVGGRRLDRAWAYFAACSRPRRSLRLAWAGVLRGAVRRRWPSWSRATARRSTRSTTAGSGRGLGATSRGVAIDVLRGVEVAFGTIGMTVLTSCSPSPSSYAAAPGGGLSPSWSWSRPRWRPPASRSGSAASRPTGRTRSACSVSKLPVRPRLVSAAFACVLVVLLRALRAGATCAAASRRCVLLAARGLPRPGAARAPLPDRRDRRLAAGGAVIFLLWLSFIDPLPRVDASRPSRCPRSSLRAPPRGDPQPDQGRGRRPVPLDRRRAMAAESGWSEPTWQYTTVEDPGTGMAERGRRSPAPTW